MLPSIVAPINGPRSTPSRIDMRPGTRVKSACAWLKSIVLFLGGGNEGIFGITYEVTGSTGNPRPIVNPISAIAPGLLRKFFEFRDTGTERSFAEPVIR